METENFEINELVIGKMNDQDIKT